MDFISSLPDDQVALIGCGVALLACGGIMSLSFLLRRGKSSAENESGEEAITLRFSAETKHAQDSKRRAA